jgi:hypothetical protein
LIEDLVAMGHEQQPGAWQFCTQAGVDDGGHDGLAGAGGGDEQIAVVAAFAGEFDLFEEAFLEWLEAQLDGAEDDGGSGVGAAGPL